MALLTTTPRPFCAGAAGTGASVERGSSRAGIALGHRPTTTFTQRSNNMSQQAPQTTDPSSRILAWWTRCGCPRLAFHSDELGEAFLTVLRRLTQADLDTFLSSDPIVVYVRPKSVAAIFRYDVPPPPPDRASSRRLVISINTEYLSHNQKALAYAVALQVARVILALPAAETPLAHQESQALR